MDRTCETLNPAEIIDMNRQAIQLFGGRPFIEPGNFANENSLLYILDAIHTSYFGYEPYPNVIEKAAAISWTIIVEHVFNDANKRTGMLACQVFLEINGLDLQIETMPIDDEVVGFAEGMVKHIISREEFVGWLNVRTKPLKY